MERMRRTRKESKRKGGGENRRTKELKGIKITKEEERMSRR